MGGRHTYCASSTLTVNAPRGDVWALWADVTGWSNWHPAVASALIEGNFRAGSEVTIYFTDGTVATPILTSVEQGEGFIDEMPLSFGLLRNTHRMVSAGDLLTITHTVEAEIDSAAGERFGADQWLRLQAQVGEALAALADLAQA
jgi:hypothetical protein